MEHQSLACRFESLEPVAPVIHPFELLNFRTLACSEGGVEVFSIRIVQRAVCGIHVWLGRATRRPYFGWIAFQGADVAYSMTKVSINDTSYQSTTQRARAHASHHPTHGPPQRGWGGVGVHHSGGAGGVDNATACAAVAQHGEATYKGVTQSPHALRRPCTFASSSHACARVLGNGARRACALAKKKSSGVVQARAVNRTECGGRWLHPRFLRQAAEQMRAPKTGRTPSPDS